MVTKLIIGLGNPGTKYGKNRHNVGFQVVDRLQTTDYSDAPWEENKKFNAVVSRPKTVDILLAKPQTFMNESGKAVAKLVGWYKIDSNDIYVIHDDLDIRLGGYKIQFGRGPRLHYGVQSIEKTLGTEGFWRVRVGVDNRLAPEGADVPEAKASSWRTPGERYVLQDFTEEEEKILDGVINKIIADLNLIAQLPNSPIA